MADRHNLTQLLYPREGEPKKHMGLEKTVCFAAHGRVAETTDSLVFHRKDVGSLKSSGSEIKAEICFSTGSAAEMQESV